MGGWHFQGTRGRRNRFFFFLLEATGHSSRRSGWMARCKINTSSSGPILSCESTGFDPWNWKSSPSKWTTQAESSLFLQHLDSTRDVREKHTHKKDVFLWTSSCFIHAVNLQTIFFIHVWWCLAWASLSHLLQAGATATHKTLKKSNAQNVLKFSHWHPKICLQPDVI